MAVLLYQIGIFLAILIATAFGKKTRNTAVILISIFTIIQVFISWLLLLQFFTIIISYTISTIIFIKNKKYKDIPDNLRDRSISEASINVTLKEDDFEKNLREKEFVGNYREENGSYRDRKVREHLRKNRNNGNA